MNIASTSEVLSDRDEAIKDFVKHIKRVDPHVRFMRRFKRILIVINGPVGAGKTTLVKILSESAEKAKLPVKTYYENVPLDILEKFLKYEATTTKEPNPYAFPLQMEMLNRRIADSGQAVLDQEHSLVLIDRNIYGDFPFARANYEIGNFTLNQWNRYMERFKEADILEPDVFIQLNVDFDISLERINIRKRNGEEAYKNKIEYLKRVNDIGNEVVGHLECPVLDLSWNHRYDMDNEHDRHRIAMAVFKTIGEVLDQDANDRHHYIVNYQM